MTKKQKKQLIEMVIIFVLLIGTYIYKEYIYEPTDSLEPPEVQNKEDESKEKENIEMNGIIRVYYVDVGQANSVLISSNGEYALIDAGNNADGKKLVNYFDGLGIQRFKYVFGTHAHEDHIGGMDDIIKNFTIDKFYMPNVITTTKTFEDVLDALDEKTYKFITPTIGEKFKLGESTLEILYVGTDEKELNNSSIVIKLYFGNTSYLFMGDAEASVEKNILDKDLKTDVLLVGHHGSEYSTCAQFLVKVKPTYSVISVGKNNTYNHPKQITLDKLEKIGSKIYRTDESGTIISISNGNDIKFETEKTDTNG